MQASLSELKHTSKKKATSRERFLRQTTGKNMKIEEIVSEMPQAHRFFRFSPPVGERSGERIK